MIVNEYILFKRVFYYGELIWVGWFLYAILLSIFLAWSLGFWDWSMLLIAAGYSIPIQLLLLTANYLSKQEKVE